MNLKFWEKRSSFETSTKFKIGDMVLVVPVPFPVYQDRRIIGMCGTVQSGLVKATDGKNTCVGHDVSLYNWTQGSSIWTIDPRCLMKITPPDNFLDDTIDIRVSDYDRVP